MRPILVALCVPSLLFGQAARSSTITAAEIDGYLRFLSSDLLEGRAPATRGGELTAQYLASQLRAFGLRPGNDTSFLQSVPIDVVTATTESMRITASDKATASLRHPDDVVVWAGSATASSAARGELVFVGYGANAPEYQWNDFKDVDVRGKVLLILVNDPPAPASEPALFGGRAMTYYGRWTYKFEEAERRGAAGALIVHTTDAAGYPWQTVVGSWSKENRMAPRAANASAPLGVRGWITDSAATALMREAGLDLSELRSRATRRDFAPVVTGITIDMSFRNSVRHLRSDNVVAVVRGRDPAVRDEFVLFSAHWDHFGIGPAVRGDSIYNGALDNASGTADLLAVARAAAAGPAPRRSLMFVFVTAEESGLLGSAYFADHPTVPADKIIANLNVDGGNLLGRTNDLRVLGDTKSSLGPSIAAYVRPRAMRLTPDAHPERGYFYRSDHFSFAKAGIPAVSIAAGNEYVGKPAGWGLAQEEDYTSKRYHQPSDEYRPDFDLGGAVQLSEIVLGFGRLLANAPSVPTWNRDAEFRALRKPISDATLRGRAVTRSRAAQ
jgi:Zn-dependent M28 family amino/carboxypeptidase